jgi:hypothetical protein
MRTIFTSLKIADILRSVKEGGQVFICHHICWLMRDKFEEIPEYKQFRLEKTCHPHRIPFDFYVTRQTELYKQFGDDLPEVSLQLFEYLNSWIPTLTGRVAGRDIELLSMSFSCAAENALFALNASESVQYSTAWEREFRINLLEGILKFDREATILIWICV